MCGLLDRGARDRPWSVGRFRRHQALASDFLHRSRDEVDHVVLGQASALLVVDRKASIPRSHLRGAKTSLGSLRVSCSSASPSDVAA